MRPSLSRRQLLSAWTVLAAGVAARPASAITTDTLSPTARAAYLAACSEREQDFHRQLIADIEGTLKERRLSDSERQQILAEATCPICGCPLVRS